MTVMNETEGGNEKPTTVKEEGEEGKEKVGQEGDKKKGGEQNEDK